jgi:hypothetical protein
MGERSIFVGIDVHKVSIERTLAGDGRDLSGSIAPGPRRFSS